MGRFLQALLHELVRLPHYKLLALALAVGGWLYVQGGQLVETKVRAEVAWTLPEGLMTTEPVPGTVSLSVTGSRAAVRRAQRAEVQLQVDLSEAAVGEHALDFASFDVDGLPPTVSVLGFSPSSVRLVLDRMSSRRVRVDPVLVGDPARGYTVASVEIDPSVVQIRGPRVTVANLTEVRTKPIDVSGLDAHARLPVDVELPWGLELLGERPVEARVEVEPMVEQITIAHVPVHIWRQAADWAVEPSEVQVTLEGPAAALRGLDPDRVVVFVHLPDNPARESYEVTHGPREGPRLEVFHPAGPEVEVVSVQPPSVEVTRR